MAGHACVAQVARNKGRRFWCFLFVLHSLLQAKDMMPELAAATFQLLGPSWRLHTQFDVLCKPHAKIGAQSGLRSQRKAIKVAQSRFESGRFSPCAAGDYIGILAAPSPTNTNRYSRKPQH
ncbi:hypothetical protein FA15DRAFT_84141 [Coprinopsis marcescibilis]|uniref:Secreted protein n=1 Tax=Coprinopsis marcescibilis TaxID=230819 RepID=A0A5C3KMK5_COPMA|nr:hypothetical protein FA15DRAFT_84141 [Coprinopsis marcescibilis]